MEGFWENQAFADPLARPAQPLVGEKSDQRNDFNFGAPPPTYAAAPREADLKLGKERKIAVTKEATLRCGLVALVAAALFLLVLTFLKPSFACQTKKSFYHLPVVSPWRVALCALPVAALVFAVAFLAERSASAAKDKMSSPSTSPPPALPF